MIDTISWWQFRWHTIAINCQFTDKKWSHRCILSEIECGQCMHGKKTHECVLLIVPAAKQTKQESGREESDSWFQVRNYDASGRCNERIASHSKPATETTIWKSEYPRPRAGRCVLTYYGIFESACVAWEKFSCMHHRIRAHEIIFDCEVACNSIRHTTLRKKNWHKIKITNYSAGMTSQCAEKFIYFI